MVTKSLQRNLDNAGLLSNRGTTKSILRQQIKAAEKGFDLPVKDAFMREEVDRVMNVGYRVPTSLTQKFNRLTIEDLKCNGQSDRTPQAEICS